MRNVSKGTIVAQQVGVARTFWARVGGLSAHAVLELAVGAVEASGTAPGDELTLNEAPAGDDGHRDLNIFRHHQVPLDF